MQMLMKYKMHRSSFCVDTADIDECLTGQDNCDHVCANNIEGSFNCSCNEGYALNEDGHTCDGMCRFYCKLSIWQCVCVRLCVGVLLAYIISVMYKPRSLVIARFWGLACFWGLAVFTVFLHYPQSVASKLCAVFFCRC